jgi:hypothetical protein
MAARHRLLLLSMGAGAVFASAMIGVSATGIEKDQAKAEVGSCAAYSGLPVGDDETAGMIFVRRAALRWALINNSRRSGLRTLCASTGSGSIVMR